jgi:hypothetical protein
MSKVSMKLLKMALCLSAACLLSIPAFAAKAVNVTATLTVSCTNCQTDISDASGEYSSNPAGPYSLQSDGSSYSSPQVQSQILTHNNVYTLDTMNTLVNGLVGAGTRSVGLHFFSPVEGLPAYADDVLPACWQGQHDLDEAVNWSVFSGSSISFVQMNAGQSYSGWARMEFNVRDTNLSCYDQINKFRLTWYAVCIAHPDASTWVVTSDSCGKGTNYGEAMLEGQGGKKNQTQYYGDWRMPFQLTLVKQ